MSDLEHAKHYLSIEIHQIKERICLIQTEYIMNMLKCFDMKDCALKMIFMDEKIRLDFIDDNSENLAGDPLSEVDKECYQQAIESLLYLLLRIRPDISLAVVILSQFMTNSHE